MNKNFKIVTIVGSPHDKNSNTRTLVEDFVEEMSLAGLDLEHQVFSLGKYNVEPCNGCWACTNAKKCPIDDDLTEIKKTILECDMIILASPVYTNHVTAQMKAFCDRLFTWSRIFPLLGKYSLSACTTGNEGMENIEKFLQKMQATYGTASLGHIQSMGGFTPGFFPFREKARKRNKKIATKAVKIIKSNKKLPINSKQKEMFRVMKSKMSGQNTFRYIADRDDKSNFAPPALKLNIIKKILRKVNITDEDIQKVSKMMSFEYSWWKNRDWFRAKSFKDIANMLEPEGCNVKGQLIIEK